MTTLREAVANLIAVKGRHHTEIAYQRLIEAYDAALAQPEQEPVGNTITFMTRAIFNVVASHQEVNGGYFIADGDVAAFVDRLAKVINSTFEPLKPKNTAPPQQLKQKPVAQVQVAEDYYPHVIFLDGVDTASLDQKFLYTAALS